MLRFKILILLLSASFSLRRKGCPGNHHLLFAASIKGSSTNIWEEDTATFGLSQTVDSFKPHRNSEAKSIRKNMIMRHERIGWEMQSKNRKRKRKHPGRLKENTEKNTIHLEKSWRWTSGKKKSKSAVCNLWLILRFKMRNFFLMPLLEEGNATGHEVHTGLCKYACK